MAVVLGGIAGFALGRLAGRVSTVRLVSVIFGGVTFGVLSWWDRDMGIAVAAAAGRVWPRLLSDDSSCHTVLRSATKLRHSLRGNERHDEHTGRKDGRGGSV
jgi:hypothetical protein